MSDKGTDTLPQGHRYVVPRSPYIEWIGPSWKKMVGTGVVEVAGRELIFAVGLLIPMGIFVSRDRLSRR